MSQSNIFDIIKMNDPTPEVVLQKCLEEISYVTGYDVYKIDVKWTESKMRCEFNHNHIDFVIYYNSDNKRTELKMSVSDELYTNYINEQRKYPQYQNKTDSEIWPQSYLFTDNFDRISFGYEDMESMVPLDIRVYA